MDVREILKKEEYKFIQTEKQLDKNVILLSLGGSYAYGTQIEGKSDLDIRGCTLDSKEALIGLRGGDIFEQYIDKYTDTTIYSFNKLIKLLMSMNPNVCEMLGCKPEHYLLLTEEGKQLLVNKKLFLSRRAINSFAGYASQQLARLENALARDRLSQAKKEEHIMNSILGAMMSFDSRYANFDENSIKLIIKESQKAELETEIYLTINMEDYPLRDFVSILGEMQNILKAYNKVNHRNKKKTDEGLDKHAMHLIRLYLMALDILEKEEIITYRENDLELLRGIRSGKFRKSDGTYDSSFFEMLEDYKKQLKYAAENTSLPAQPNTALIEEFVMEVNRKIVKGLA